MKIEIIKQFRLLPIGKQLDVDTEFSLSLINRGFAKSLEPVEVVEVLEAEKQIEEKPKAKAKTKK
jgi:hypothetical protein